MDLTQNAILFIYHYPYFSRISGSWNSITEYGIDLTQIPLNRMILLWFSPISPHSHNVPYPFSHNFSSFLTLWLILLSSFSWLLFFFHTNVTITPLWCHTDIIIISPTPLLSWHHHDTIIVPTVYIWLDTRL